MNPLAPYRWLAIAGVISAALAFSHFAAYRSGKANVRAQWDAAKVVQQEQAIEATRINHAIASQRQTKVIEAQNAAQTRNRNLQNAAAGAIAERQRLLDAIAAGSGKLPTSADSPGAIDPAAVAAVLAECAGVVTDLAGKADQWRSDAMMLEQAWPK